MDLVKHIIVQDIKINNSIERVQGILKILVPGVLQSGMIFKNNLYTNGEKRISEVKYSSNDSIFYVVMEPMEAHYGDRELVKQLFIKHCWMVLEEIV